MINKSCIPPRSANLENIKSRLRGGGSPIYLQFSAPVLRFCVWVLGGVYVSKVARQDAGWCWLEIRAVNEHSRSFHSDTMILTMCKRPFSILSRFLFVNVLVGTFNKEMVYLSLNFSVTEAEPEASADSWPAVCGEAVVKLSGYT